MGTMAFLHASLFKRAAGHAWKWFIWVAIFCAPHPADAHTEPYRVLLLHSFRTALPINAQFAAGVSKGLETIGGVAVEVDSESLDLSRFDDETYTIKLKEILRFKYRDQQPDLIIPTYTPALRFLLEEGEALFPGVPIVFCAADLDFIREKTLPPHITGITVKRDFGQTLQVMRQLDPDLKHVAMIVGSGSLDRSWESFARAESEPFAESLDFVWLKGLAPKEIVRSLNQLPPNTAALYIVQFMDASGVPYVPRAVVASIAMESKVPIFGTWDTLIGSGIIGGWMANIEGAAFATGKVAARVLLGEAPASIPVAHSQGQPVFDGRQLARWKVLERRVPENSRILFPQSSIWQDHRDKILLFAVIVGIQAILIIALYGSRARLRRAQSSLQDEFDERTRVERISSELRARLANLSKQSALGALATGIAHEVNQPLVAIKNYAQAANRYVSNDTPNITKVIELLKEMEWEAIRAGTIINKLRGVVRAGTIEPEPCSILESVSSVLREIALEMPSIENYISIKIDTGLPKVFADPLQLQLVIVNLLRNAAESINSIGASDGIAGSIVIDAELHGADAIEVLVSDNGKGVSAEYEEEVFDPLFSTKATGTGIGLATCRTIIEAHGGKIWVVPNHPQGAVFHFLLPVANPQES